MSEEASNLGQCITVSIAAIICIFFVSRCVVATDATTELRKREQIASEEKTNMERVRNGFEYVPSGTWIKRNPSIEKP